MNAKELVDSIFEGYEQTDALIDFKEELLSNLNAKVENLVKKGMPLEAAFTKASEELGDVSALADELSLKKRKEVFEEVYMDTKKYMGSKRVAAYVIIGILALFGIITGLISYFAAKSLSGNDSLASPGFFGAMLPFLTCAVAGFTFLGCTQETASSFPIGKKRAAWYAAAAAIIAFGIFIVPLTYFGTRLEGSGFEVMSTIAVTIPFLLPGIGLLTYLVLTEKDRLKPWAKDFRKKAVQIEMEMFKDPVTASRFGILSGSIWIFALGFFILFGLLIGFKFSWIVFIFATAIQLLVQGLMSRRGNDTN